MNAFTVSLLAVLLLGATSADVGSVSESRPAGGDTGPVYVDSTEILYLESYPVQVRLRVEGSQPTPCHELAYEVRDLGSAIDVLLWSVTDPDTICITVLEPFEASIPLGSFETADLPVYLNGEEVGGIEIGDGSSEPILLGSGWSFGMCLGYCVADLVVEGDELSLTGGGWADQEPLYTNRGLLTAAGKARIAAALATLDGARLDPVYGCPDCADGGAAYLEFAREGMVKRVEMEFNDPPDLMAELYGISASLMTALETCTSNGLVDVTEDCAAYRGS